MAVSRDETPEEIEGVLDRIVFRNEENGYTVARLLARDRGRLVTVTGNFPLLTAGETLRCRGAWVAHARFGRQFRVDSFEVVPPNTREGIVKFLSSGLVKGIGPKLAARMVKRFGEDTLRVIEEEPRRLGEIPGIGAHRLRDIMDAWSEQREIREIMVFLRSFGAGQALARKIHSHFGGDTVALIRQNPYRLCEEIFGVGFRTADKIALNLGVEADSPFRIRAVLTHLLDLATGEGHLCLPFPELVERAVAATGCAARLVEEQIAARCEEGALVVEERYVPPFLREEGRDDRLVFRRPFRDAEVAIRNRLRALKRGRKKRIALGGLKALRAAEAAGGLELEESQAEAVLAALEEPVLVITGGPGVGKTTIIRIIARLLAERGLRVALAAPTGRAAKRLAESSGFPASTIHRLLKFVPRTNRFEYCREKPLPLDGLILDECSMVDVPLAARLLEALPDRARLLLVGDADQLPPVGPGDFLRSLIASGRFPVARLRKLFRQKERGGIIEAAHAVNRGEMPLFTRAGGEGEIFFVEQPEPARAAEMVVRLVTERIPARFGLDPVRDVQVLTPMHKGPAGTVMLNTALRGALNPPRGGTAAPGGPFRAGDKVMQVRNNYELEVFNGDIGFVETVDEETGALTARMDEARVSYPPERQNELVHAYCVSVHKSQGCEFPAVVLPLLTQHFLLLKRNLLYTGITRARRVLVIVGARKALGIAVGNDTVSERFSLLTERLKFDDRL